MNRKIAVLALLSCAACYSGDPDLGKCNTDSDCVNLADGGQLPGAFCSSKKQCEYACQQICGLAESCVNATCVLLGPEVQNVNPQAGWVSPSQSFLVTAQVDDSKGPGIASATLRVLGKPDIAGTTTDTGKIRVYSFSIPGAYQASGSEAPIPFTIIATDTSGGVTPDRAAGQGQARIDGLGPRSNGVTITGGVAAPPGQTPIRWFARSGSNFPAVANITDAGSGVKTDSLKLMVGATQIDTGIPSCAQATAQGFNCTFMIDPKLAIAALAQGEVNFKVVGTDIAANAVQDNTNTVGIDDKKPTITFAIGGAQNPYPAANANCNADPGNLFCGHDGAHFWRSGDGNNYTLKFSVSDSSGTGDVGSGVNATSGKCTINGVATCTVTFDSASGNFTFPADFSKGSFASGPDGTGTLNVTVDAADGVGNPAVQTPAQSVAVTRVKWVRKTPVAFSGAPVLSARLGLVIAAGTNLAGDPIVAVKVADGSSAWSAGAALAPPVTTVTSNIALDTTTSTDAAHPTPVLYVNSGDSFYALHIGDAGIDKSCTNSVTGLTGSPMIFGAGVSALAVVTGAFTTHAYALRPAGGGCIEDIPFFAAANTFTFGPPSAKGSSIYFGFKNTLPGPPVTTDLGIRSIQFSGTAFAALSSRSLGKQPTAGTNPAAITPAADLFFGVNADRTFFRHAAADLAPITWTITPLPAGFNIFSQPLVSGPIMLSSSNVLTAFNLSDAQTAWTVGTDLTQVSPPTLASTTIFVSDQLNKEMLSLDASTQAQRWAYTGLATTTPSTRMSSVATEATLGSDGVLYFGDSGGRLYALFVDDTPLTTAAGDWPRTGYDNCNSNHSNNAGFVCQ